MSSSLTSSSTDSSAWQHLRIEHVAGVLLIALGGAVLLGWVLQISALVRILPGYVAMVFNTALCFVLSGAALLITHVVMRRLLAILILLIAVLIGAQDVFALDLHLDDLFVRVWLEDPNPNPGRMAPQTAVCFILVSLVLLLDTIRRTRFTNALIQILVLTLGTFGLVGLIGYSLKLELLYSWYRYTRMAVHTAAGMTLLAVALWLISYRSMLGAGNYEGHEDRRVSAIGMALVVLVAVSAGVAGFALLARHTERVALQALTAQLDGQRRTLLYVIQERLRLSQSFAQAQSVQEALRGSASPAQVQAVRDAVLPWLQAALASGAAAVRVSSSSGAQIAVMGQVWTDPQLELPLDEQVSILWRNGARLRHRVVVVDSVKSRPLGSIVFETELPLLEQLIASTGQISATADLRVCGAVDAAHMQCLPTRLEPRPMPLASRTINTQPLPASEAIDGKSGAKVFINYRNRQSIGAYGPLGSSGIAFVIQQDTEDTFAAIRAPLQWLVLCLTLLVGGTVVVLRWQVAPLLRLMTAARAEAAANSARVEAIMNSVPDGILTIDLQGRILAMNPAVTTLFGYEHDELIGNNVRVLMPEQMHAAHEAGLRRYVSTGEGRLVGGGPVEVPARRKDGSEFTMQLSLTATRLEGERRVVGILRDVTERRANERLKDEFISVVSHELRTPLTSISGSLGLLAGGAAGELPGNAKRLVDIANQNSQRLGRLINDILDLEKAAGGKLQLHSELQPLMPILLQVVEANQPYAQHLGVGLVIEPMQPDVYVNVDRDRLAQVLTNVISNAAKFSPPGAAVRVRCERLAKHARISVEDRGEGIPEAFRTRIFQRFAQADSSDARAKGGTGLGLSIAKTLIERLDGEISYESSNEGTTFYIQLPIAQTPSSLADDQLSEDAKTGVTTVKQAR